MQDLTPEGRRAVDDLAQRYGVGTDAVLTLLRALVAGNGAMAQFSHPELGGMGQWSQGGMTMVGDMFNRDSRPGSTGSALSCRACGAASRRRPPIATSRRPRAARVGRAAFSLFVPAAGGSSSNWWPADLGCPEPRAPRTTCAMPVSPSARRLAIQIGGRVTVYDTQDHQVGGFSQQQGPGSSLTFTSQSGLVRVADLPIVPDAGAASTPADQQQAWAPPVETPPEQPAWTPPVEVAPPQQSWTPPTSLAQGAAARAGAADDVIAKIERLADLRQKGILTEEEFAAKKSELLARL